MKKLYKITLLFIFLFAASLCFAQDGEREKGIESYNQGEYQKAAETLEKIVETDEKDRKAWLYLGMSYAKLKNKSKVVKALKKADKIKDEEPEADTGTTGVIITFKPWVRFTDAARQNMTQGMVKMAVEFGADGKIKSVVAFQTLPDGLTENCIAAAKSIRFTPATKDGKPVTTVKIVEYTFTIY